MLEKTEVGTISIQAPLVHSEEKVQRPTFKQGVGDSVSEVGSILLIREDEDMVCSTWRHVAGVLAHRVSVAN